MSIRTMIGTIACVVEALDAERVPYAVTGSVASAIHGEPVTSVDIDLVVEMTPEQAQAVAKRVDRELYADVDMLRRAAIERGMANFYDAKGGVKVDISVLSDTAYHREIFKRRTRITHPTAGLSFWVVSPEDVILMKIVWRRHSHSEKQWDNALSVVRVKGGQLDWAYLRKWAAELGVEPDLDRLAKEAGI